MTVLRKAVSLAAVEGSSAVAARALLQVAIRGELLIFELVFCFNLWVLGAGMQQEAAKKSTSDCSESDAGEEG